MIRVRRRVARRIPVGRGVRLAVPSATARSIGAMCGRYTVTNSHAKLVADRFGVLEQAVPAETLGRFNVCPTETVLGVCGEDGGPAARPLRWGLVPPWARTLGAGPEPINARLETVRDKPLFAPLVAGGATRCLVVADGWYEWLRPEHPRGERVPFRYSVDGGGLFAFAGLWHSTRVDGARLASATVLTTTANEICAPVHDRMPCVLGSPEAEAALALARASTPRPRSSCSCRSPRRARPPPRPTPRSTARAWRGRSCSRRRRRPSRLS